MSEYDAENTYLQSLKSNKALKDRFDEQQKDMLGEFELSTGIPLSTSIVKAGLTPELKNYVKNKLGNLLPEETQKSLDDLFEDGDAIKSATGFIKGNIQGGIRNLKNYINPEQTLLNFQNRVNNEMETRLGNIRSNMDNVAKIRETNLDANETFGIGKTQTNQDNQQTEVEKVFDEDPENITKNFADTETQETVPAVSEGLEETAEISSGLAEADSVADSIAVSTAEIPGLDLITAGIGGLLGIATLAESFKNLFEHHNDNMPEMPRSSFQASFNT